MICSLVNSILIFKYIFVLKDIYYQFKNFKCSLLFPPLVGDSF
ncbi:unnamed protein product, partial [Vitis vinifera]|uniref:Uncharacterized protein n=1 Tax=Vitis vinifera TaxID=29760 RepID=D7TNZ3_VITVI